MLQFLTFRDGLTFLPKQFEKWKPFQLNVVADRPRCGRQRLFNERRKLQLLRAARQDPWTTGVEHGIDFGTSAKTVLRVLSRYGLKPRTPSWGPIMT